MGWTDLTLGPSSLSLSLSLVADRSLPHADRSTLVAECLLEEAADTLEGADGETNVDGVDTNGKVVSNGAHLSGS